MSAELQVPRFLPPLDPGFRPLVLQNRAFRADAAAAGAVPLVIGLERSDGTRSRYETVAFPAGSPDFPRNIAYAERLVKTLLWAYGGRKVTVGGPREIGDAIRQAYAPDGARAFDAQIMGRIYERIFTVEVCDAAAVPPAQETAVALGGHLDGCRIGIDLGASDRKAAAVIDGKDVYSEEVVWDPKPQTDPQFHFDEIMTGIRTAAAHLPHIDAIGISSAGVYVNNLVRVASLFRGVSDEQFESRIKRLFFEIQQAMGGIPLEVVNDGEVTALAGAMQLNDTAVLGVAMGSSEAAGHVTPDGTLTNWLNELAFAPIDANPDAPADEWSGDIGCGALYLSQQCVGRLVPASGLPVDMSLALPERLKAVQALMKAGDARCVPLYQTVGIYLGYALAYYADFYQYRHALVLGRVTSGDGGDIIIDFAQRVLAEEFPELTITLFTLDEERRRVGQAIAAASLPARVKETV
jgi:predicted NBD/HSP70 family sugar kinase